MEAETKDRERTTSFLPLYPHIFNCYAAPVCGVVERKVLLTDFQVFLSRPKNRVPPYVSHVLNITHVKNLKTLPLFGKNRLRQLRQKAQKLP